MFLGFETGSVFQESTSRTTVVLIVNVACSVVSICETGTVACKFWDGWRYLARNMRRWELYDPSDDWGNETFC